MSKQYVITNERNMFWTGSSWASEYPAAKVFTDGKKALTAARKASENGGRVCLISNYGMANETIETTLG